jgi:hypothetical protein
MAPLLKRDNMGYDIHPILIVFLIMLGSAVLLVCCYGFHQYLSSSKNEEGIKPATEEQMQYMKEVRARNQDALMYEVQESHFRHKGRMTR